MTTCAHLDEVRQSLAAGQWPHAAAPELRAHAQTCTRCAQEILLTTHFQQARANTIAAAQPGTPSLLWWRAQLRRRNAALTRAARPLAAAHVFAFILVIATIVGVIASRWHNLLDRAPSAQSAVNSLAAIRADWGLAPLILAITLITTLGGVAVYLSTDRH
jgi:hypothetical protein